MPTKKVARSASSSKRRKALPMPPMSNDDMTTDAPKCQKCHHLPFGVSAFVALLSLMAVTLSMFVLTSLSMMEKQNNLISALQAKVGSVAER